MKTLPVEMETIDLTTGKATKSTADFMIQPPPEGACQVCGRNPAHEPELPHDAMQLYYQYAFYGEHGRWPTWTDAMAHCDDEMKAEWEMALRAMNKWDGP